jgi:dihydroflavonol-4-reductase
VARALLRSWPTRFYTHAAVARILLTGATGLIGSHIAPLLAERGDDVRVTVRPDSNLDALAGLDAERVRADILDRRAIRRAMRGIDRVFHAAGTANLALSRERTFQVNVEGTRIVLEEALRAQVERVVYTSSVAAIGPAPRGSTADETQVWDAGRFAIPYLDAKHEAEVEVLRMVARGLPAVIVNPAYVLGAGDPGRSSTVIVRRFLRRQIPVYVDGTLNIVAVEDVARGHLLADEIGRIGERYILGNRNFTLQRLFADLGRLSGVEPPAVKLAPSAALALATATARIPRVPASTSSELRAASLRWAFRNTKAKRELGWSTSPHEDCLEATIAWYRERDGDRLVPPGTRQPLGLRLVGGALRRAGAIAARIV